jgi:3-hydroxyisobutyrate dehydrogenase-like beta-hydroxyacid dehydrogenase
MQVGFIGLGKMGFAMASRLLETGHRVTAWNRSARPAEELVLKGAVRASQPKDVFDNDVVLTMLSEDEAIREVITPEVMQATRKGAVHVMCATISVAFAKELAQAHADAGLNYVAAPVLGRPNVAQAGALNIFAAGDREAVIRAMPVLDCLAKKVWQLGAEPSKANAVKLATNFTLFAAIEAMSEAFVLARRYGVEPQTMVEIFTETIFAAPAYKVYGPIIAGRKFEPAGAALRHGLKDVRLMMEAGEAVGVPLTIASLLRDNFLDAIAHGDGDKDLSAIADVSARRAGI